MKFIYALLVVAAATISAVNGQSTVCSVQGACAKEGERCDTQYYNFTEVSNIVTVACEYGTFCVPLPSENAQSTVIYPVCVKESGLGELCGTPYTQCGTPYECHTGPADKNGKTVSTCQMLNYLGYGESCDSTLQCGNDLKCLEGECKLYPNTVCQTGQCPYGQWCNGTDAYNVPTQCVNWKVFGAECSNNDQCAYDHYCGMQNAVSTGATCQPIFGKNDGDVCSESLSGIVDPFSGERPQCASGLACSAGTCQAIVAIPTEACGDVPATQTAASCPATGLSVNCQCNSVGDVTGKCRPYQSNFNANCQTSYKSVVQCAIDNQCPTIDFITLQPESCMMKNCADKLCENSCDATPTETCGDVVQNPICNVPSSSSIVLPSFVMLIVAIIALLL